MFVTANDGRIMAGIAEVEMPRCEVKQSEPEGDKHTVLVVVATECIVDAGADLCGHHALLGES